MRALTRTAACCSRPLTAVTATQRLVVDLEVQLQQGTTSVVCCAAVRSIVVDNVLDHCSPLPSTPLPQPPLLVAA